MGKGLIGFIVKKFGGTSVATLDHIGRVSDKIIQSKLDGDDVVVIVSAMGKETDRLVSLADDLIIKDPMVRENEMFCCLLGSK